MKKVLVNFIQDRSGSMSSVWEETLNGFKTFVADLRSGAQADDVEYLFSLTTFDTTIDVPLVAKPIADVDVDIMGKYGPRGGTALYDAIGKTIQNTEANRQGAEKVIVVIVTDGHENSSREWSKDALHKSIESHLNAGDWTFTYLGTQPETWDDATSLGIAVGAVASYDATRASAAYLNTSNAVRSLSRSTEMGSRTIMASHLSVEDEVSAGMKVQRGVTGAQAPNPGPPPRPQPPAKPTETAGRWR